MNDELTALFEQHFSQVLEETGGNMLKFDFKKFWLKAYDDGFNCGYSAADSHGQDLARYAAEAEGEKAYWAGVENERNGQ